MSAIISTLIQAELKGSLSCEKMTNRSVLDILSNGGYPDEGKRTTTSSSSTSTSLNKTESMRKFDVVDDENENKIIDSPHSIVSDIILTSTISTARNNRHNNNNNNNNNHLKHHHHSSNNNNSVKHSLQNISSKRKSKRRGFTSLPAESETSYSSHIGYQLEYSNREQNENELTTRTTPTSTLVYSSSAPLSTTTRFDRNNDVVSTVNSNNNNNNNNNTTNTVTINSNTTNGIQFSGSRGSSSLRKSSVIEPVPSTSSWHNSVEQETDYVVDPAQGNAYYKGQFLGKGGFARVYLMTDASTGSQYACKIIPKNRMQKIHMQKIAREVTIHKELNHVNVVQMHHYFEDNRNVYMLLEACPQKSLMHVLKYRGKVTEPEARYYMKQMVTGVAYIHSQRVVHRDLKPGNMFLSNRMIVKIGDFGLATRPDGQHRRVTICGTPNYIAPEVLHKQAYSYEADVWALGCILYALLVGQPPFDTASLKETYARIRNNRYREVDDTIASPSGQDLIRWLLQPNPELRPSLERVKEHAYLTKEYVPASLPHTCCYQMPHSSIIEPPTITSSTSKTSDCSKLQTSHNLMQPDISRYQTMSSQQLPLQSGKVKRKQGNVKNWLARKIPKLPRFRQRLRSVLCPDQKKFSALPQSVQMHRALESCIASIKSIRVLYNPPTVDDAVPLFVTKWIDYSNKYGLGFQLSDKSVGVLFNDSTKMSYTHDRRRVEYVTTDDEITRYHRERDIPVNLQKKLDLIRHFTEYMDGYLTEGGEVKELRCTTKRSKKSYVPRMRRWLRTNKAIVMELTVPLLQVNFFVDHTKMIVSLETAAKGYLVTYIDAARHVSSYWLNDIRDFGCTSDLRERLHYVCKVSREFAKLDNNTVA